MDALKACRKAEAAKIAPKVIHLSRLNRRTETDRKEAWRAYEKSELQKKIIAVTGEPPPPGWSTILEGDDYLPPVGDEWPPTFNNNAESLAEKHERHRLHIEAQARKNAKELEEENARFSSPPGRGPNDAPWRAPQQTNQITAAPSQFCRIAHTFD